MMESITLPKGYEIDMNPETINPPEGTYFLRAIKNWNPKMGLATNTEVSISLQRDGQTIPLRSYGYILDVDKGGILKAYDRDITSEFGEENTKVPSARSSRSDTKEYNEEELEALINNTKRGTHNEIIVKGNMIGISEAFIVEGTTNEPGLSQFKKDCLSKGIKIHIIPRIKPITQEIQKPEEVVKEISKPTPEIDPYDFQI